MPDPVMVMQSVKFVDNEVGWTAGEWHSMGVLFRSTDGGITWQQQNEPTGQRLFGVEALDRQTVMVVGGGTYQAVTRRSTDGGVTWADMPVPLNDSLFLDIFFVDSNNGWITGLDGGIAHTTDGGITWHAQNAPHTLGLESIHFSTPLNGWAGGYYGALLHTTDGGTNWVVQNPVLPDFTHVLSVAAVSSNVAWIAGYGGGAQSRPFVKKTTNGGATWVDYTPSVGPYDGFGALLFAGEEDGWAGGHAGIFRRIDSNPPPPVTPTPTQAAHPTATATATPILQSTGTATPRATLTTVPTNVPATSTATSTTQPSTPQPSSTPTSSTSTSTAVIAATNTPQPATATPQPTAGQTFSDVFASDYFYTPVNWLVSRNIVSGYPDGTFRPYNFATRGQIAKIVVLAEGWSVDTPAGPHFSDVPTTNSFYPYIETALRHGVLSGYPDSTFRPSANVTRGQLAKIIVSARGWTIDTTGGPHFSDVPQDSTFYSYIETALKHQVLTGYAGGTFRPANQATRGQIAKIVYGAINGQ
jgi:photosystem II stability/assembly factor-like uncharacterized protein